MPALLIRTSRDSTAPAAAWICAGLVTSSITGVTRLSGWARGWRVAAYTRLAPLFRASAASACPIPRLDPVTRTVLPAIAISVPPVVSYLIGRGSGQRAKARGGEQVGVVVVAGAGHQAGDRLPGLLGGERRALAAAGGRVCALPGGVGGEEHGAQGGRRG